MKLLIKTILILISIFTATLLLIKFTGILTVDDIKEIFTNLKSQPSYILGGLIVLFLFIDLFIAVPTMTIIILAGYFIGFELALFYTTIGLLSASLTGYFLSKKYGNKVLNKLSSNEQQKQEMTDLFNKHGVLVLVLSRAVPMLPEISSCLAGACNMSLRRFLLAWFLGTIPYVCVIAYAGSISNLDNPMPAIYAALGITILFWFIWMVFMKIDKRRSIQKIV
ncbi:MAG: VTT domain-containing protein [Aliarcobacter sp.]|nr:VTT domain-containing protein [Aliarcobacter sp.]